MNQARTSAANIARQLAAAGHRALFAGGCVRDKLMGLEPADYDVATSATPQQIAAIFPKARGVGESFGVMLVRSGDHMIEVATFRADGPYDDGRRPTEVRFASDREDACRRDFTINGLFEDPENGQIIDYVDGQADVKARLLRAIGDAHERFREDRLRTLRAVRFAARFHLAIHPDTLKAVREFAHDLAAVSRERVGNEMRRMLTHSSRARALELCEELGLAPVILNEPAHALNQAYLRALPHDAAVATSLAAWMLGRACAPCDRKRVAHWRTALMLSNQESDALGQALLLRQEILAAWKAGDAAARKRLAASADFGAALQLVQTDDAALAAQVASDVERLSATGLAPPPYVTGDDLTAAGLPPGPRYRTILVGLYDRQLNGEFSGREQALRAMEAVIRG